MENNNLNTGTIWNPLKTLRPKVQGWHPSGKLIWGVILPSGDVTLTPKPTEVTKTSLCCDPLFMSLCFATPHPNPTHNTRLLYLTLLRSRLSFHVGGFYLTFDLPWSALLSIPGFSSIGRRACKERARARGGRYWLAEGLGQIDQGGPDKKAVVGVCSGGRGRGRRGEGERGRD